MEAEQHQSQSISSTEPGVLLQEQPMQDPNRSSVPKAPYLNESYTSAHPAAQFPIGKLLLVVFGPGALLLLALVFQIFVRFIFTTTTVSGTGGGSVVSMIINLISALIGLVAVVGIILMPVFIIVLVVRYSKRKNQQ